MTIKRGDILKVYTDDAARGNPNGPAVYAFMFVHDNDIIHQGYEYIGTASNNTAEYQAIINALKAADKLHIIL